MPSSSVPKVIQSFFHRQSKYREQFDGDNEPAAWGE